MIDSPDRHSPHYRSVRDSIFNTFTDVSSKLSDRRTHSGLVMPEADDRDPTMIAYTYAGDTQINGFNGSKQVERFDLINPPTDPVARARLDDKWRLFALVKGSDMIDFVSVDQLGDVTMGTAPIIVRDAQLQTEAYEESAIPVEYSVADPEFSPKDHIPIEDAADFVAAILMSLQVQEINEQLTPLPGFMDHLSTRSN